MIFKEPKRNGISRPKSDTSTIGQLWDLFDRLSLAQNSLIERKDATAIALASGFNHNTVGRQYGEWKKYNLPSEAVQTAPERSNTAFAANISQAALEVSDPIETAVHAVKAAEDRVARELLTRLHEESPEFFEKAVIRLLLAMGYGGRENFYEHSGQPNDGGIDGIIKQDPLGIQKIYLQAKRYADNNSVGRDAIQSFVGALHPSGVASGVFLTTSNFTSGAREYARSVGGKVILIDGKELAKLMIRYRVGIQTRQVLEIVEIDEDFFIEDGLF